MGLYLLSFEEVSVHAGHKVRMENDIILLIAGDPQGILDQQLRLRTIEQHILDTHAGKQLLKMLQMSIKHWC
jgi:hypothetical protein